MLGMVWGLETRSNVPRSIWPERWSLPTPWVCIATGSSFKTPVVCCASILLIYCYYVYFSLGTRWQLAWRLMLEQKLETDKEGERKHSSYVLMSSRFLPLNHVSKQLMTNHLLVYCLSKCYNYFPYSLFICLSDSTRSEWGNDWAACLCLHYHRDFQA